MTWQLTVQASTSPNQLVKIIITLVCAGDVSLGSEKKIKDQKIYFLLS